MRWPIVVLAALAAFPTVAGAEVWREQSRQDADARGLSTIEIHNARGRIDVTPSSDGRIHLTAIKIVHLDGAGRARDLADQITVDTDRRGDHYVVEVHYPQRASFHIDFFGALRGFDREFEVRIAAEVPPALGVEARSASGVVTSEGVGGAQLLRTASGDIEVRSAGRRVEVSSSSGAIEASDLGASARIHSVSGDLTLHHVRGALDASTSSGAIRITGAEDSVAATSVSGDIKLDRAPHGLLAHSSSGSLEAEAVAGGVRAGTVSGDIRLAVRDPLRGLEASSSSGSIRVALDPAVRCVLDMRTSSGSLDVHLPVEMQTMTRRHLEARVRGGTIPASLRSVSGNITVTGGGQ